MKQLITPTPIIPCMGGWCLQYVRQAYGLDAKYASATEAWEKSTSKHRDRNFPPGLWIPVWYGIAENPLGHVVLLAPDGRVYSTSDYSGWPVIHNSLSDLEAYYAYYDMTLQYRGWTEDVASYAVLANTGLASQGNVTPKPKEDELSAAEVKQIKDHINAVMLGGYSWEGKKHYGIGMVVEENQRRIAKIWDTEVVHGGKHSVKAELVKTRQEVIALTALVTKLLSSQNTNLTIEQITEAVKTALDESVIDVDINIAGKPVSEPAPAEG